MDRKDHLCTTRPQVGLSARSFDRILLIKPSSLGDIIHALPVLHGLRTRYPNARIDWLIASSFAPLLSGHPDLDELILFDRRRFGRVGTSLSVTKQFIEFVSALRRRRYEMVIDLQGLLRTGFLAWAGGAPVRIGLHNAREGARFFYTHKTPRTPKDTHAVDRNYQVAQLLGFEHVPIRFDLNVTDDLRAEARALLRCAGHEAKDRLVAIVPGARWETKMWASDRFAETMNELQSGGDLRCVLLGSPDEAALCERIFHGCRLRPINLTGKTTLGQMAAVIELADVVLCHDSAPMHLAVALQRPLVCLIGPTNPDRTGPYGRSQDVVRLDLECAPCYLRKMSQCRFDHQCMVDLEVSTVVSAVRRAVQPPAVVAQ